MGADDVAEVALASGGACLDSRIVALEREGADVGEAALGIVAVVEKSTLVLCKPPSSLGGTDRFAAWIRSLRQKDLEDISASFATWKAAELAWLKSQEKKTPLLFERKSAQKAVRLATRLAKGWEYARWLEGPGSKSKAPLRDFLRETRVDLEKFSPMKERQYIWRCWKAWCKRQAENADLGACLPRARRLSSARARMPENALCRRRGRQGARYKSPELRELLWEWFVDMRASVATILSPKILMCKAREIAERILQSQRTTGCYAPLPDINRMWFLRWKRDKGVVLRRPNARFKCSKEVLVRRLRAMWINLYKVRHLASRLLGDCLSDRIFGIDEKPLHMNEGGSKGVGTLEVAGAPVVKLKENHAQTRERVSLMTSVTSCPVLAASSAHMPLEMLVKAKTNRRTSSLVLPAGMRVSLQYSEKGSYRTDNILQYLLRWLDPWTELRAKRKDWRILQMDVAKSHLGPEVLALCHSRGYCCLLHYGCTTGVAQVNDTDLHAEFSHVYIDLEQLAFNDMQLYDPACFSRTLQAVLDDACGAWRVCSHLKGVKGHKTNGLSNALDGSEDHLISTSRDAGRLWREMNMYDARLQAMQEVDAMIDSGSITSFDEWQKVVVHPSDPGVRGFEGDGCEFEGEDCEGEPAWLTDVERARILRDDAEVLVHELEDHKHPPAAEEPLRLQLSVVQRLARLRELRASTVGCRVPAAVGLLDAEIRQLERGLHAGGGTESQEASIAVRALMDGVMAKEREEVRKRAKTSLLRRQIDRKRAAMRRKANAKAKAKAKAKVDLKRKLDALPVSLNSDDLGKKALRQRRRARNASSV